MGSELEGLVNIAKDLMEKQEFESPDDDWIPHGFVLKGDDLQILLIDPGFFADRQRKHNLFQGLAQKLREERTEAFALALMAYTISMPSTGHPEVLPSDLPEDFSEHPSAREILIVHGFDADDTLAFSADVLRSEDKPPTLGEWESATGEWTGEAVTPFRQALKAGRREQQEEEEA